MPVIPINDSRTQELNTRLFARNIPSHTIDPVFSPTPTATRYTKMAILDNTENNLETPITGNNQYQTATTFFPGDRMPNRNGFVTNVDTESVLRNQFFALQRGGQAVYVPESSSDLYTNKNIATGKKHAGGMEEDEGLLFSEFKFDNFNPTILGTGSLLFHNSTRTQRNEGTSK